MSRKSSRKKMACLALSALTLSAALLAARPAAAATYNIHNDAEAWKYLGHEPANAQDSTQVTRYFGKGAGNTLNLWANKLGNCTDYYAGNGNGHTLNFNGGGDLTGLDLAAGTAGNNILNVTAGSANHVSGAWAEGNGSTNDNKVVISGGAVRSIYGGYARMKGSANSNTVRITGGNIGGNVSGYVNAGRSDGSGASNNVLVISGGRLSGDDYMEGAVLRGGAGYTEANGNTVDVSGFEGNVYEIESGFAYGGSETNASNNVVMVGNAKGTGIVYKAIIDGGLAMGGNKATANNNNVQILGGNIGGTITGGRASGRSVPTASNNTVELRGGVINGPRIYGGYAYAKGSKGISEEENEHVLQDPTGVTDAMAASSDGEDSPGIAYGNTVVISGSKIIGSGAWIYGGYANGGRAERNTVWITGGTVKGTIVAGDTGRYGVEKNNTIELYTLPDTPLDLTGAKLYGTMYKTGDSALKDANPVLNVYGAGIQVDNIYNFAQMNFYLPDSVKDGDTMLEAVGKNSTVLNNPKIGVAVPGGTKLKVGDEVYLFVNRRGIIGEVDTITAQITEGVSLTCDMDITLTDNALIGTLRAGPYGGGDGGLKLNPQTKSLVETRVAGLAALNSSVDGLVSRGFAAAEEAAAGAGRYAFFASAGGQKMRYKTGSHVDSRGWGLAAGFAREFRGTFGSVLTGPFVEHGRASYDSYLDDGVHADGKNRFTGGGWFVRGEMVGGFNWEASARFGRLKGDYQGYGVMSTKYEAASDYAGFHAGVGKTLNVGSGAIDVYGKYFYTRQKGTDATLSTGERYHFDAVSSSRLRLGARWSRPLRANLRFYAGAAWDYEFSSEARATYRGYSTPAPSLKGSSGMLELGLTCRPNPKNGFSMDFNVTGWAGKQRGITGAASFQWRF